MGETYHRVSPSVQPCAEIFNPAGISGYDPCYWLPANQQSAISNLQSATRYWLLATGYSLLATSDLPTFDPNPTADSRLIQSQLADFIHDAV